MTSNNEAEAKLIKNAIIDLLHFNKEVSDEALVEATGLELSIIRQYHPTIETMLDKLKKARASVNFKG